MEATLVLGVLARLVHGEDIGLGEELGALLDTTTDLLDGLEGGVEVAGADEVAGVEGDNLAISLEVIDVKGEVDGWKVMVRLAGLGKASLGATSGCMHAQVLKGCRRDRGKSCFGDIGIKENIYLYIWMGYKNYIAGKTKIERHFVSPGQNGSFKGF